MATPAALPPPSGLALALRATRPQYIPTSLVPGLVGIAAAASAADPTWWLAPVVVVALFCAHAGTNVINDVEDFDRGVDGVDKVDNSRVFTTGLMSVADGRRLALALFATAFVLGLALSAAQGFGLLIVGCLGLLAGYGYSAGPAPLKYAGLGDAAIVFAMGPLITQGAYTAVAGDGFDAGAWWIGFAPGLLIACVLAGNNLSDIPGDRDAGVRTLAVRLGFARARALYLATLALAYATPVAVCAAGLIGWPVLAPLLTAPLAFQRVRQVLAARGDGDEGLLTLAPGTAQLHLAFCVLLAVGVLADRV